MYKIYNHIFPRFKFFINQAYNLCLDILSPPCCAYCKILLAQREVLCSDCTAKLQPVVSILLPVTATKTVKVLAVASYNYPIKQLVLAKSYSDVIASYQLAQLIWERTDYRALEFDYLVPIPLHWRRFAKRGFNQAEEIAHTLSKKNGKPVAHILKRSKQTEFQAALRSDARGKNVADAFSLQVKDAALYKDKHIVLIDDLMTTGSTLRAAAKELYKLKVASVTAVVGCRVI